MNANAPSALPVADFDALGTFLRSVGCGFPAGSLKSVEVSPATVTVELGGGQPNESITAKYSFSVPPEPEPEPEPTPEAGPELEEVAA